MPVHPFDPEEVARFEHTTWSRCAGSYMEGFGALMAEARQRHPRIELRQASADALPLVDGRFVAIVSNFMLHHVGRPDQVLREACRTLRKSGRASFTVWGEMEKLEAFGLFFAAVEEHTGAAELPHKPLFGVSDCEVLAQMARDAGFAGAAARPLPMAWRTPGFPPETREAIENSVRKGAEAYRGGDGYVMPNPAILITGVK